MARKKSTTLTEAELRLMDVLWKGGALTVAGVVEGLEGEPSLAYSTVLTTLRILETKGFVRHTQEGRAFVYEPLVDRGAARRSAVSQLVSRFFDDSHELLVLNLLEDEKIGARELERLRELVNKKGAGDE